MSFPLVVVPPPELKLASFNAVSKNFGRFHALRKISFDIGRSEILALLGPNGAGKSTSLKLLSGLRRPTYGQVRLFGMDPTDLKARRRLGVTPQDLDFPPQLKVREILCLVAASYQVSDIHEYRDRLQLQGVWNRRAHGLSGGEKRRLGLACALVGRPELLLLDEPTTGLDVESRRLLWQIILEEKKRGASIVLTTHYLDEVEKLADRVLVIDRGQILFSGSVRDIRRRVELHRIDFEWENPIAPELEKLKDVPHLSASQKDELVTLWTRDSDATLRALVANQVSFRHLNVHPASLEEAFMVIREEGGKQ